MTGYESKRAAAQDKLEDDDTQIYQTELTKLLMESYDRGVADALEETKKALAQPVQEPAYWGGVDFDIKTTPAQRPWVGLTDEEVKDIVWNLPYEPSQEDIRAIEAKLKEKNT